MGEDKKDEKRGPFIDRGLSSQKDVTEMSQLNIQYNATVNLYGSVRPAESVQCW